MWDTRLIALDAERAAAATAIAKLGNAGFLNLSQSVVPPERSEPIALSAMGCDRVVGERAKLKWPNPLAREGTASLSGLYF